MKLIGSLLGWLLSLIFGPRGPKIEDVAASNATAQAELTQERNANEIVDIAATARRDAAAAVVRDASADQPVAALKRDFPDDFRD